MAKAESMTYNKSGEWVKQVIEDKSPQSRATPVAPSSSNPKTATSTAKGSKSADKAKKELIEQEITTLEGDLEVTMPDFALHAKQTLKLGGLGNHLDGKYFVNQNKICIGNGGVKQTLTVVKNAFSDDIKAGNEPAKGKVKEHRRERILKMSNKKTHTVQRGETIAKVAQLHRMSMSRLIKLNQGVVKDPAKVRPGTVLVLEE